MKIQISLFFLPSISFALAAVLEQRNDCNADNCLRALRGHSVEASNACATQFPITQTVGTVTESAYTQVVTQISVVTSTSYSVVWNSAAGSAKLKRGVFARNTFPSTPTSSPQAADNAIPARFSACSGVTRFSSACSCATLLPTGAPSVTVYISTVTSYVQSASTTTITSKVCDPADNYGYLYNQGSIIDSATSTNVELTEQDALGYDPGYCCAQCFESNGCLGYQIGHGGAQCTLTVELNGTTTEPSALCPFGVFSVQNQVGTYSGNGPCVVKVS
ncbi:MAG: hypothetical protein M1824_001980 [Vezdaea acicularis]|nr:MAG: hypothetical protein M1824_001980 [Vezdaea acicularis]